MSHAIYRLTLISLFLIGATACTAITGRTPCGSDKHMETASEPTRSPQHAAQGVNTEIDNPEPNTTEPSELKIDRPAKPAEEPHVLSALNLYGDLPGETESGPTPTPERLHRVSFSSDGGDFDVAVSPNGERLVFASTSHSATPDLFIKHIDGKTITQITDDPASDMMPSFSPDGRQVAFTSNRAGNWDIWVVPVAGGKPMQLTNSTAQDLHPSWSPDGRHIVYSALSSRSGLWELVLVNVSNPSTPHFLGDGRFPEFSPDGTKIAFQRARQRGTRQFSIWTVDFANGQTSRATEIVAAANAAVITPTWSPDGRKLAFATVVNPGAEGDASHGAATLWVVNIDGTGKSNLTNDRFTNVQPVWSPDGRIYFVSNRSGSDNIWALHPTSPDATPTFTQTGADPQDTKTVGVPTE